MFSPNAVPNEIFIQIFTSLAKTDLASASQTCRRFQALADPLRYCDVDLATVPDNLGAEPSMLHQFLRTILEGPVLGHYVRSLTIRWSFNDDNVDCNSHNGGDIPLFTEAARNMALLESLDSPGSQLALLLYLLPNIRSLVLIPQDEFDTFAKFMEALTLPANFALPAALTSVSEVTYCPKSTATARIWLRVLFNLPSIRKIAVSGISAHIQPAFDLSTFTGITSISDFHFCYGSIPTSTLTRALEMCTGLTRFSYLDVYGNPNDFDPALFGRALRASRNTLQYLRLSLASKRRHTASQYPPDSIGSLQDYPALRTVWCPFLVLLGRKPELAKERLVCVLPPAIEELRIGNPAFDLWPYSAVRLQVTEVLEQKGFGRFVKLVKLTMMSRGLNDAQEESLRAACDAVGVTLCISGHHFC